MEHSLQESVFYLGRLVIGVTDDIPCTAHIDRIHGKNVATLVRNVWLLMVPGNRTCFKAGRYGVLLRVNHSLQLTLKYYGGQHNVYFAR